MYQLMIRRKRMNKICKQKYLHMKNTLVIRKMIVNQIEYTHVRIDSKIIL
jgi:hypothetical protein